MLPILQCNHDPDDVIGQNTTSKGVAGARHSSLQGEEIIYVEDILHVLRSTICLQRYIQNNFDG